MGLAALDPPYTCGAEFIPFIKPICQICSGKRTARAYLDGELTAAQRAEVEGLLEQSPAARQLLEELRALSGTLQALPRQRLPEDLSSRVLDLAERQMLLEGPAESRAAPQGRAWWSTVRRHVHLRALVWSGIAVAVAVLFMFKERPSNPRRCPRTNWPCGRRKGKSRPSPRPSALRRRRRTAAWRWRRGRKWWPIRPPPASAPAAGRAPDAKDGLAGKGGQSAAQPAPTNPTEKAATRGACRAAA